MKSVYKATLLATATTLICGFASAGSQNGAEPDAWRARTAPFQAEMAIPPSAPAARSFDATQTPRLPVLMLTQSYGDSARELFAGGAVPYTLRNFPFKSTKTIVYLDADTFNPRSRLNREALALAKEAGWPVVIESDTWNAKRVAELAAVLFPEAARAKLSNTSVIVEAGANGVSVRDTWPSEVAMKAGIPSEQTSEGKARVTTKASGDYKPVHWSVHFAQMAYERNPGDMNEWKLGINRDIIKTWVYWKPGVGPLCMVAFRGSETLEDWMVNGASQFRTAVEVPGVAQKWKGKNIKIGKGFADRLSAINFDDHTQCTEVYVTGHSLGGAMAQAYALRELLQDEDALSTPENIRGVFVYNPARLGTLEASREFVYQARQPAANFWGAQYMHPNLRQLRSYCRSGDPVWYLPIGLYHGMDAYVNNGTQCTHSGKNKNYNASKESIKYNHSVNRWFYED